MALKETPVDYDPFAVTSPPMAAKGYREIPVDYDPFAAKPATVAKPAVLPPPSMDTAVPVGLEAGNLTNYDIENALALDAAATAAGRENAANMGIISGADAIAGTRPPKPLPVLPPSRATRERERQLFDSQYSRDQVEKIIGSEFIGKEKVVLAAYEERLKQLQSGFKTAAAAGDRDAATRFQEEAQAIIPEYQAAIGRFNATVQSLREGAPLYTSEFSDPWPTVLAKTGKAFFPRVGQGLAALFGALEETSPNRELFEKHGAGSTGMAAAKTWGQIAEEASPVVVPGTPKAWVSGALESVALNAPMALAGMASGSLALPLVGMGLIAGGQKYAELREKRPDIAIPLALSVAAGSGTMEGLTELIPLKTLLRTDIGIGKKLVNEMFQEIPTEMANTIYADLQDKMTTRPNMTWGDFLQDEIDTIMTTAIATPIMVGSTHKAVKYLERKRKEAIEADQKRIETYAKDVMADEAKLKQFKENLGIKDEGQPPEGPSASGPSSARPQPPPPVMPPPAAPAPSEPPLAMPPPSVPPRPVLPDGWLANRAGYPYKTEKSATEAMAKKGLAETHEVVAYENGFALKPKEEPVKATEEKTEEEVPPPPEIVQNAPTSQAEGTKYPVSGVKLYHSSDVPILDINPELYGSKTDEGLLGKGFYLSTDKNIGQGKGITSEFETSIESPLVVEYPEWGSDKAKLVSDAIGIDRASGEQLTKELISRGYDSVVLDYAPVGYDHKEVAIFDKAKLKPTSIVGEAPPSRRPVLPPPTKVSGEAGKPSTKTFVENKIRQLGSIEAVNAFYSGDDAISQYARQEAPKILGIKEKEPTTATKKEKKLPYGRSGVSVFKKIAATANLSEENSPDYDDFVSFFEQYYNAGVSGKDMPAIDMHPQDAHAAYQAGRDDAKKDQERSSAKKPVLPPPKKKAEAKPAMPVGNNVKKVIDKTAKEGTLESKGDEEDVNAISSGTQNPAAPEDDRAGTEGSSPEILPGIKASRKAKGVPPGSRSGDDSGLRRGAVRGTHGATTADERLPGDSEAHHGGGQPGVGGDALDVPGVQRPVRGRDHAIEPGEIDRSGSWRETAKTNLDIIELIKKLDAEGRQATPEEQKLLARYTGWGASEIANNLFPGFAQRGEVLPSWSRDKAWTPLVERLMELLTPEEIKTAARSTQYAHYTSPAIINSIYRAMEKFGFPGGKFLEPGMGVGSFFGLMPNAMRGASIYTGIEFDHLTAAIAKYLYPNQNVILADYTKQKLPNDFFDVAIGNPPFSSTKILTDPDYKKLRLPLHDYFFIKSMDKVRPGGLMIFITSRYTMDKQGEKVRNILNDKADLLGAIRLPQTAFKQTAGTEVVTDILFLRKKTDGETTTGQEWGSLKEITTEQGPFMVNEYYVNHPEMVLGTHSGQGSMYSKNEYTVLPKEGNIEEHFAQAVENLPENVYSIVKASPAEQIKVAIENDFNPSNKKEGGIYVSKSGEIMVVEHGRGVPLSSFNPKITAADKPWLKDYIVLRDQIKACQYDQLNDGDWEKSLATLKKTYVAFVKKHGRLKEFTLYDKKETDEDGNEIITERKRYKHARLFKTDVESSLVLALENITSDNRIVNGPFLEGRTIQKPIVPDITSVPDALAVSLDATGKLDLDHIAKLVDRPKDEIVDQLGDLIYEVPGATWMLADEYLSGDVKKKLDEAKAAAEIDHKYQRNVEALLKVQPAPLAPHDITVNPGANWIPLDIYNDFIHEVLGQPDNFGVYYNEADNSWNLGLAAEESSYHHYGRRSKPKYKPQSQRSATSEWGTPDRGANEIFESVLNNATIRVTRTDSQTKSTHTDAVATAAANDKAKQMKSRFRAWVWEDVGRTKELLDIWNSTKNNIAPRRFDGSHLTLPGVSLKIKLWDHVKRGVWRIIQTGNTYLAHAVGAGKTYQMIAAGMEMRRLGLIKKPLYVVPNHMLQQFANEFQELYPMANVMVADEENFHKENRRRFTAQATLNNPDAIIMTHSSFGLLKMKAENIAPVRDDFIDELRDNLSALEEDGQANRIKIKKMERRIEQAEQRFDSMIAEGDNVVAFEDMGVDFLFLDEAHQFRKLDFTTNRQAKGIDSEGSRRAMDLYIKILWLESKNKNRSHVFASGTPVTNTLGELYSLMRFFREDEMAREGMRYFDSWANMFGNMASVPEMNAAGRYEIIERFSEFVNVPELMSRVRMFMDVLTMSQLGGFVNRPEVKGGKPEIVVTPPSKALKDYQANVLQPRIKASRDWKPSKEQPGNPDPIINIITDGRLASIDLRFVASGAKNDPDSKLNKFIDGIIKTWKETKNNTYTDPETGKAAPVKGGAQIVFYNHGFGKIVARNRGFDARAWAMKRFKEAGIPSAQIAWMDDYDTAPKKEAMFKELRNGTKRILIGSAKKMGTGLNVQRRLTDLHYLDAPWYPADVEQPDGRIIRQGNQNKEVSLYRYATKGSYDATMWQMVSRKSKFVEQALSGDANVRKLEDISEASQYEMAAALASGDERAIKMAALNADIDNLHNLSRAHFQAQRELEWNQQRTKGNIGRFEERIRNLKEAQKQVPEYISTMSGKIGNNKYDDRKTFGEDLLKAISKTIEGRPGEDLKANIATVNGFALILKASNDKYSVCRNELRVVITPKVSYEVAHNIGENDDPKGISQKIMNRLNGVSSDLAKMENSLRENQAELKKIEGRLGAPFEYAQELNDKIAEAAQLTQELIEEGNPAAAAGQPHVDGSSIVDEEAGKPSDTDLNVLCSGLDPIAAAKAFRAVADDIKAAIPRLEALGKAVFDAGKQTYEDWTRAMKRHLGELWAKFKGYLEDIWKNAKAMNQRQKFKKLFDKKDKERGSISFKKKTVLPQPGHKFESPETEALFQSAKGIKKETVIEKIKAVATEIGHKIARDYEHLANSRQNAPLIFILKRLEKQRDVVADRTAREIGKVLSGLDKSEYDIFARKVILDDLLADVERGKYDNEKELPFKFTAESLAAEKARIDALVDENPKIAAALAKRKAMWEVVKGEYIDALKPYKANVEDMFKENYYRHQVLDYVESNGIFGTGSKRLAPPVSRGYTKERTGYAGLYNTDYLEAEHNIMAQMLYDIEMAEALTGIKSEEDISAQVKAKAKEKNFENLVGGPKNLSEIRKLEGQLAELRESGSMDSSEKQIAKGIIERLNELDPTRPFKQKIAMSFAKLRKLGVIDDTDIDYGGDLPGGIFSKLSELINEEGPWQKPIATIFKAIRERENLMRQTLGAKYLEWQHGIDKRAIPPGYTAWQPREGNVFYPVLTVDEKTAAAIMAGELDKLAPGSGDLFKKAMAVGGKRTQWIVRDEVAETLNNLTRERAKGIISSVDLKVMVAWKKWQLISPRRMIKYNIRNLTGDAEATFLGNPAGFGYVPQAIRELYAVFVGKQPMSADMLAWFTRGGMSSTLQAQEMDALKQAWMFTKLHDKEAGFLKNAWQKYWKVARLSTDFRESILRYASFLSYKEQLKKNGGKRPDNYGASKPETIDALDNIDDKAFWLSNDLLGAYDRVSVSGQWIRERAIPFWSWQEVNMKRYVQLFRNAADNGELATAIGKKAGITSLYAARKVGGFLIKAAAFAAILAVYNNLFWPDEEEKLPWDVRMRAHIILGKDADGNIEYFSRMGTLDDFLSWFGLDYIPKSLNDLLSGKSIKDVASAQAVKSLQAAPNKAVQGAVPFSKLGFELITRRSTFPDIFRPGAIRDRYLHIARSFGLENEYIALAGKPSRGYGESLNSLFMYKVDPNEADYRKAFDLKRDFLKKMGKEVDGFWITPDGDALYNMRLAMRYDDREAFRKYFMEYVERKIREGKDDAQIEQGIKRSLKSMHPVSGMSRGMQEAFARSLTDEEMKIMHGAVRFYYDVLEMGDNDDEERR